MCPYTYEALKRLISQLILDDSAYISIAEKLLENVALLVWLVGQNENFDFTEVIARVFSDDASSAIISGPIYSELWYLLELYLRKATICDQLGAEIIPNELYRQIKFLVNIHVGLLRSESNIYMALNTTDILRQYF